MKQLLTAYKKVLYAPIFVKLFQQINDPAGAVFMFHRVDTGNCDAHGISCNRHLSVSQDFLDEFLGGIKKAGFSFISMDELAELLSGRKKISKVVALTFDDGYADNIQNALPVCRKYDAPFTIYVATGLLTGEIFPWWDLLEEYILGNNIVYDCCGNAYDCTSPAGKENAFLALRKNFLKSTPDEIKKAFFDFGFTPEQMKNAAKAIALTPEEIRQFADHRLVSFGIHTHTHTGCWDMSCEEFSAEIRQNIKILSKNSISPVHFAYPFGDKSAVCEEFEDILRQNNISSSVTTDAVPLAGNTHPYRIPRFFISPFVEFDFRKTLYMYQLDDFKKKIKKCLSCT